MILILILAAIRRLPIGICPTGLAIRPCNFPSAIITLDLIRTVISFMIVRDCERSIMGTTERGTCRFIVSSTDGHPSIRVAGFP